MALNLVSRNGLLTSLLYSSIALVILGIVGYAVVTPLVVRTSVYQEMRLVPENEALEKWANFSDPIYLSVHLFNITNVADFENGATPILQELGPYVYLEKRTKRVDHFDRNVISYSEFRSYRFVPEYSSGDPEKDIVYALNIPLVSVADFIEKVIPDYPWLDSIFQTVLDALTYKHGEEAVVRRTVAEMLFTGYDTPFVVEAVRLAKKALPSLEFDAPDRFGLLINKNGSVTDKFKVGTGAGDLPFTKIVEWNGKTELPYWGSKHCNQINGTDGSQFPPFLHKEEKLQVFSAELCRSIYLQHESDTEVKGIETQRYVLSSPDLYPRGDEIDTCFCEAPDKCDVGGVISVSKCRKGLPIIMSAPHFYLGEPSLAKHAAGLKPLKEKHETFLDISSITGLVLRAAKRLQINIEVKPSLYVSPLGSITPRILPVAWVEERMEATPSFAATLRQKLVEPQNLAIAVSSLTAFFGGIAAMIVMIIKCIRNAKFSRSLDIKNRRIVDDEKVESQSSKRTSPMFSK